MLRDQFDVFMSLLCVYVFFIVYMQVYYDVRTQGMTASSAKSQGWLPVCKLTHTRNCTLREQGRFNLLVLNAHTHTHTQAHTQTEWVRLIKCLHIKSTQLSHFKEEHRPEAHNNTQLRNSLSQVTQTQRERHTHTPTHVWGMSETFAYYPKHDPRG